MKRLLMIMVLLSVLCSGACARLPQVGDDVSILASLGSSSYHQEGIITDIGNGFLCYQMVGADGKTYDQCIGIGAIVVLFWNE